MEYKIGEWINFMANDKEHHGMIYSVCRKSDANQEIDGYWVTDEEIGGIYVEPNEIINDTKEYVYVETNGGLLYETITYCYFLTKDNFVLYNMQSPTENLILLEQYADVVISKNQYSTKISKANFDVIDLIKNHLKVVDTTKLVT